MNDCIGQEDLIDEHDETNRQKIIEPIVAMKGAGRLPKVVLIGNDQILRNIYEKKIYGIRR